MFKYQHILEAIAERAKVSETPWDIVQFRHVSSDDWVTLKIMPKFIDASEYRIKPKTININGHEVPEPLRVKPKIGDKYSAPCVNNEGLCESYSFDDGNYDNRIFERSLMHKTKEAAIAHAKALLSFTEQKND